MDAYTGPPISVDDAYSALQLEDRYLDDDMVLAIYQIHADDGQISPRYRECLRVIGQDRRSRKILSYLGQPLHTLDEGAGLHDAYGYAMRSGDTYAASPNPPSDFPVGLVNIGNTCFLNSLLQYYATIADLRAAVVNFNEQEALQQTSTDYTRQPAIAGASDDTSNSSGNEAGDRKISRKQREHAIHFTALLGRLYREMTAASDAVRPSEQLAQMALTQAEPEPDSAPVVEEQANDEEQVATDAGNNPSPEVIEMSPPKLPPRPLYSQILSSATSPSASPEVATGHEALAGADEEKEEEKEEEEEEQNDPMEDVVASTPWAVPVEARAWGTPPPPNVAGASWTTPIVVDAPEEHAYPSEQLDEFPPLAASKEPILLPDRPLPVLPPPEEEKAAPTMTFGKQEDVTGKWTAPANQSMLKRMLDTECMNNIMELLNIALSPHTDESVTEEHLVKQLFYGKMKQSLGYIDPRTDQHDGNDLYDGMDKVFGIDVDPVRHDSNDPFACQLRWTRGTATGVDIATAAHPTIPGAVHATADKRVQYDREQQKAFKSNSYLRLSPSIYMDRYMASNVAQLHDQHQRYYELKKRLEYMKERIGFLTQTTHGLSTCELLKKTIGVLEQDMAMRERMGDTLHAVNIKATIVCLREEHMQLSKELIGSHMGALQEELAETLRQVPTIYDGLHQVEYRLHAVFMHRGQASYGHYWIYIYDWEGQRWFKYNDAVVSEVSADEVFKDTTGDNANPYCMVYVRAEDLEHRVQTIYRGAKQPKEGILVDLGA
ncbi:hypothetical protein SYNPS1DRAFT_27842 [Syncephalis pseudoplumigaleata]|uniref:Ubiquitin carboxyl-terminal hydrolase n=1 Tax=Syncephalis pseudoplumigaleata TaxID=1712513 RepID=A0A4P9Z294_9FUNG|nr:hypothetical protein SYNPS1DRAFT_27842 [Syncephalis pseudoplumigaleata]|eukprot:RKP26468.1 hypothetical protein SYNPS1DRAFT_27842 [Syncephalis pseudoplumigaleata]